MHSFFSAVRWCLVLSWQSSKFYTLVRILADMLTPLLSISAAFVGKHLLDLLAGADSSPSWLPYEASIALIWLFALLFGIALLRLISQKAVQYSQTMQGEMINAEIATAMMQRALKAALEYFDNPAYYDQLQSATQDAMNVSYILWHVLSCVSAGVSFLGAFIILYTASPLYGFVMVLVAIPSSIAAAKYTKLLYMLNLEQVNEHRQMYYCQHIASDKAYAQEMRLFNAGEQLITRYRNLWQQLFSQRKWMTRKRSVSTGLLACLPEIALIFIGVNIAFGVLNGYHTVGDYVLFTGLAGQLWASINMLSSSTLQIYDNKLKIENIIKLDNFATRVIDNGTKLLDQVLTVQFENVSFTYPGATTPALRNISCTFTRDEKTVMVGLNGSGKSTLVKLLLRLYDPTTGVIRINGEDIKTYQLTALRKNFSVYFQDMLNYNFPLRENFTIADDKTFHNSLTTHSDDETAMYHALQMAYGQDITDKLHKGLATGITRLFDPEGIELSGGQHQKLALARALYRHHTALILDEPSSNLDPKAEHEIFQALRTFTEGKFTLFTSHRLSNITLADRIIVLEHGCIVEDGTHEVLLANKDKYAELFQLQKEKYV